MKRLPATLSDKPELLSSRAFEVLDNLTDFHTGKGSATTSDSDVGSLTITIKNTEGKGYDNSGARIFFRDIDVIASFSSEDTYESVMQNIRYSIIIKRNKRNPNSPGILMLIEPRGIKKIRNGDR
ncbi:MAG: hypothetical protein ACYS8W_02465 [Planctomycetota bacterium]